MEFGKDIFKDGRDVSMFIGRGNGVSGRVEGVFEV